MRHALLISLFLIGCGDKEGETAGHVHEADADTDADSDADTDADSDADADADTDADADADTDADTDADPTGEELYTTYCVTCHAEDGTGVTGLGKDITRELHHDDAFLISVMLNGYEDLMEPVDVTEKEAQLIVDYMRATFE